MLCHRLTVGVSIHLCDGNSRLTSGISALVARCVWAVGSSLPGCTFGTWIFFTLFMLWVHIRLSVMLKTVCSFALLFLSPSAKNCLVNLLIEGTIYAKPWESNNQTFFLKKDEYIPVTPWPVN
jgi:hypothetical protein